MILYCLYGCSPSLSSVLSCVFASWPGRHCKWELAVICLYKLTLGISHYFSYYNATGQTCFSNSFHSNVFSLKTCHCAPPVAHRLFWSIFTFFSWCLLQNLEFSRHSDTCKNYLVHSHTGGALEHRHLLLWLHNGLEPGFVAKKKVFGQTVVKELQCNFSLYFRRRKTFHFNPFIIIWGSMGQRCTFLPKRKIVSFQQ